MGKSVAAGHLISTITYLGEQIDRLQGKQVTCLRELHVSQTFTVQMSQLTLRDSERTDVTSMADHQILWMALTAPAWAHETRVLFLLVKAHVARTLNHLQRGKSLHSKTITGIARNIRPSQIAKDNRALLNQAELDNAIVSLTLAAQEMRSKLEQVTIRAREEIFYRQGRLNLLHAAHLAFQREQSAEQFESKLRPEVDSLVDPSLNPGLYGSSVEEFCDVHAIRFAHFYFSGQLSAACIDFRDPAAKSKPYLMSLLFDPTAAFMKSLFKGPTDLESRKGALRRACALTAAALLALIPFIRRRTPQSLVSFLCHHAGRN